MSRQEPGWLPRIMSTRSWRGSGTQAGRKLLLLPTQAAVLVGLMGAACGPGGASRSDGAGNEGSGGQSDAGNVLSVSTDGGGETTDPGIPRPSDDAGADSAAFSDAGGSFDAAPAATCAPITSIGGLVTQYGSDSTASTVTPMGTRFEAAAQAGPISAANASFLATATANPVVGDATSATSLTWQAVTVKLYPSGMPSPADINQHAIGDCNGDSAMAAMAYVNPSFVRSVLADNGDGTFNVSMFDPTGKPITVVVDSEVLVDEGSTSSLGQVSALDGSADWATVLEKAVMKYDYAYGMVGQIDGIGSEELIPMFTGTGGSIAFSPGSLTSAQFQQVVTVSLAAGKFITGGFNEVLAIGQDQTVTAHGYAVMVPTDPSADMADMRNPWGVNPWESSSTSGYDTSTDGLLQLPLSTAPNDWAQIVDLRIIDPGALCAGATTPFAPQIARGAAPIHIREPHALRAR